MHSWVERIIKSKVFKYVITLFGCVLLMFLWWQVRLQYKCAREEIIVESGTNMSFEAKFEQVHSLAFSNDDPTMESYLDENPVALHVGISDEQGNVLWEQKIDEINLSSFAIIEYREFKDFPIMLNIGQTYHVFYSSEELKENSLTVAVYGLEKNFLPQYLVVCALIIIALLLAIYFTFDSQKIQGCKAFFIVYMILAILYSVVLPPFSVQDEWTHFAQAYAISSNWMGKEAINDEGYIYVYESGLVRMNRCDDRQTGYRFWRDWDYGNTDGQYISGSYTYAPNLYKYIYYASAVGITIARLFHAPYQIILLAGRFTNLLLSVILSVLALKIGKDFRQSMLAVLLLPSVVWIYSSYSYDAWNMSLSMLIFAYCMYCRSREKLFSLVDAAIIIGLGALLVPAKFIYFVMAFTIFLVPGEKFKNKVWQFVSYIGVSGMTILAAFAARGSTAVGYVTTQTVDTRSVTVENMDRERYTLTTILENPVYTVKVYINTLFEQGENYIYKCINGSFLSVEVPKIIIYGILFIMLIVMIDNARKVYWRKQDRYIAFGIFAIGCGLVLTTFLLVYSYIHIYSIGTIFGVQGRYFLPFLLFLPFIFKNDYISIDKGKEKTILLFLFSLNLLAVMCNFSAIVRGM